MFIFIILILLAKKYFFFQEKDCKRYVSISFDFNMIFALSINLIALHI